MKRSGWPRRILVVFKASKLERYRDRDELAHEQEEHDADMAAVFDRLQLAHEEHERSVTEIEAILEETGLDIVRAIQPRKRDTAEVDLVITVGGDGTFLWTARKVERAPMLGVNSAPGSSTGHYCAATASTLREVLDRIRAGGVEPARLPRIRCEIDGRRVPYAALNEVLVAHRSPAGSSRYLLRVGDEAAFQVSSGLWVSTASGSTGAILSAGGARMHYGDQRLQFLVREPYLGGGDPPSLLRGMSEGPVEVLSRSPSNGIWLDGAEVTFNVGFAGRVVMRVDDEPLRVFGYGER